MLPSRAMRLPRRIGVARPVLYHTVIALLLCAGILYSFTAFDKGLMYWTTGIWSQNRSETFINQTKNLVTQGSEVLSPNPSPKPRLYFETDASNRERLELESNIQYSAMLKKLDKPYFDKRRGTMKVMWTLYLCSGIFQTTDPLGVRTSPTPPATPLSPSF